MGVVRTRATAGVSGGERATQLPVQTLKNDRFGAALQNTWQNPLAMLRRCTLTYAQVYFTLLSRNIKRVCAWVGPPARPTRLGRGYGGSLGRTRRSVGGERGQPAAPAQPVPPLSTRKGIQNPERYLLSRKMRACGGLCSLPQGRELQCETLTRCRRLPRPS